MADRFFKMHGLGNDFVVIDAREGAVDMPPARARAIADRRRGIGCDQLVILTPSATADVAMRIINADGTDAGACGNAARCVATLLPANAVIETAAGPLAARHVAGGAEVELVPPAFDWELIPLALPMDTADMPVGWPIGDQAGATTLERPMAVNVGNPHIVFFLPDAAALDGLPLGEAGPVIETDPLFPERVNVGVAAVTGPSSLALRVWERGAGLTLACGTGAAAAAVCALRRGLVTGPVTVTLPGGRVTIAWDGEGPVTLGGPAQMVFAGETDWSRFG